MNPPPDGVEQRFAKHIAHRFFVRFHMSLILTAVIASGVLTSKGLLELGLRSLRLRYPLAVLGSYLVFILLVRLWIWYVKICCTPRRRSFFSWGGSSGGGGSLDLGSGRSGGGSGAFRGFAGGNSGGGGASDSWVPAFVAQPVPASGSSSSSSSSSWLGKFDLGSGGDGDEYLILILLGALILAIVGAGGYLVWAAPHILPEAATQAFLASTIARTSRHPEHSWFNGVLHSTWMPFVLVVVLAAALGWSVHRHCPVAVKLMDAWNCPTQR